VRKSWLVLLAICAPLLLVVAAPQADTWQRPSLEGLSALRVSAEVTPADAPALVRADSLRARTERRLRAAAIRVLSPAETDSGPPAAVLHVNVAFARLTAEPLSTEPVGYAFACGVELSQAARTMPGPGAAVGESRPIVASTWESWKLGNDDVAHAPAEALRALDEKLDEFVKDWVATHTSGERR
jgi:hypothetical protein